MAKKKIRPMGEILLEMEVLREELLDSHDLQWGDLIFELFGWLQIHRPDAREKYKDDDSSPILYYGHKDHKE